MNRIRLSPALSVVSMIILAFLATGCTTAVRTGTFPQVNRIERELQKGVSKNTDVQRILGIPKGIGGALLPTDTRPKEVWLYDNIELTGFHSGTPGVLNMDMRQQILLIFFDKGVYDGHMWYSNAGTGEAF